jgi:hypothetical protein
MLAIIRALTIAPLIAPAIWITAALSQGILPQTNTTIIPKSEPGSPKTVQTIPIWKQPLEITAPTPTTPFNPVYKPNVIPRTDTIVIDGELGGRLDLHWARYTAIGQLGNHIEILGACESACTMVMAAVPRERICFGKRARLSFHQARDANNIAVPSSTQWMVDRYPSDIAGWIAHKGGVASMPLYTYWHLPAPELWAMGYKRCE